MARYKQKTIEKIPLPIQKLNVVLAQCTQIPWPLLLDLTSKTLTIEEFADIYLKNLDLSKQQIYHVIAGLTGYSPGTVENWCRPCVQKEGSTRPQTPRCVLRILGILHVIYNLFKNYNIRIEKKPLKKF